MSCGAQPCRPGPTVTVPLVRYGLTVTNFWHLGAPGMIQEIARTAELAGWDGLFVWDHVSATWAPSGVEIFDPWVILAGAACVTERILLGTNVTPVPRRRPQVLAMQVATLDHLSGGRAVLGVGLGGEEADYKRFGESFDPRDRAGKLDEALQVIVALWSGDEVNHLGDHYTVDGVRNLLRPVEGERCPIWVGGDSRPARRRAAQWDGWTTGIIADPSGRIDVTPEEMGGRIRYVLDHRASEEPFDVVVEGVSDPGPAGDALVASYEAVGATWWCESIYGLRAPIDRLIDRIAAGPPRP